MNNEFEIHRDIVALVRCFDIDFEVAERLYYIEDVHIKMNALVLVKAGIDIENAIDMVNNVNAAVDEIETYKDQTIVDDDIAEQWRNAQKAYKKANRKEFDL